jgi:proteasome accessory factor C
MPATDTAAERIQRVLYILPAAGRAGGATLRELAEALGVDERRIGRDVTEAGARAFYTPAGQSLDANVLLDGDRVVLDPPSDFRRPSRFTDREAVALVVGLRSLAVESPSARAEELRALAASFEAHLALRAPEAAERMLAVHGERPAGDVFEVLRSAARDRRTSLIHYLRDGGAGPEARRVDPYALIHAERWWYVVGWCHRREAVRVFRVDRVVDAESTDAIFEVPPGFDAKTYAPGGRAFVAPTAVEARVRYGAGIARWLRERYPEAEERADGSVVVTHRVADPRWLVRHVLQYGVDAEVLGPAEMRRLMGEMVRGRGTTDATEPRPREDQLHLA